MLKKLAYLISMWLLLATGVQAATLTVGSDADTYVATSDTTAHGDAVYMYLHDTANAVAYLRFNLAELNVSSVEAATLTLYTSGGAPRNDNVVTGRFFLRGLNNVAGNTPQNWDEATLTSATVGAEWRTNGGEPLVNVTDLDDTTAGAGIVETITRVGANYYDVGGIQIVVTGPGLVAFLQSRVDDDGMVTFLMDFPASTTGRGFGIASKEHATQTLRPVLELTATTGVRTAASSPSPADEATEVARDAALSWRPGAFAGTHDVYLGTSFEDVASAAASVLVSQGQDANTYDPSGSFAYGQTYYWRIDEVNDAPDFTVHAGPVWSFTVELLAYPIANVIATASSSDGEAGPEKTVDNSGLANGLHSTLNADMWMTARGTALPAWIQFEFDRVYKLHEMRVWNSNTLMEGAIGVGCKEVAVEYSTNGSDWTVLNETETFNQAPGAADYAYNTTVDFAGAAAKYVKLSPKSNWGDLVSQCGLSEVQFFQIPVQAREPMPASGTTNVDPRTVTLSWKAGREAASHEVYLGTDMQAVAESIAPVVTVNQATYTPPALQLDTTYYWKVVEVNEAAAPDAWDSDVWSFSTPAYLAVEDFEVYTDDIDAEETIYQAWIDGYGDDANGSYVGYPEAPFAEQSMIHSGRQSMPFSYENTGSVARSEAKRTFVTAQDWTQHDVKTLVLFFRGQATNSPASVYLKINDKKISFNNGAPATSLPLWKQWNIDLATAGVTLKSIKSLTIGVEGSGTGRLFIDDIRLYAVAPEVIGAADPGATGLVVLYKMDGNVQDSSGKNYHGTLNGDSGYDAGYAGQALNFNGTSTYVDLPIGPLMPTLTNVTVASHVNFSGGTGSWQRVFDFGTDTTAYMFLSPRQSTSGGMRFAIRTAAIEEQGVNSPAAISTGWHHMAVTIDSATMTIRLYLDGEQVGEGATVLLPKDLGATTQNWLGRSQWTADAYLLGLLDEFRIYNRVLSAEEVRYLAGDR